MSDVQGEDTGWREQVSAIGKMIVESQTLDGGGEEMSAYQSYLRSVQYIMQYLAADITTNQTRGSLPSQPAAKLFKMAKHCLERAEEMYDTAQEEGRGLACRRSTSSISQDQPPTPSSTHPVPSSTIPIPTSTTSTLPLPAVIERAHSVPSGATSSLSPRALSPIHSVGTSYMREARRKNQYMMDQYKAHLRQTSSQMLPHSQEMGLSMLRRLEENISVAKIRQQNLARKARERQLRLQQADSKAASKRPHVVRLSQLSVEELKEQVASFEHGKHFPILTALKNKLSDGQGRLENLKNRIAPGNAPTHHSPPSPSSTTPSSFSSTATEVYNFVNEILSNPDHPLSRLLGEYQMEVFTLLKPVQSAREKAGNLPKLFITLREGEAEVSGKSEYTAPAPSSSHHTPPTSPPTADPPPSHPPTITSSQPPTITIQTSLDRDPSHLHLFYESEDEDDDLFTLSNADSKSEGPSIQFWNPKESRSDAHLPPGDHNFNSETPSAEGEMDDKLKMLQDELEQEIKRRESSTSCEDGGRLVTCVHKAQEEEGADEEGGTCGTPVQTGGEEGGVCEDRGRWVTQLHTVEVEGGSCEDGGRWVTQVHTLVEEEGGVWNTNLTASDRDGGADTTTVPAPHYSDLYTDADDLARHLQRHSEAGKQQQNPSLPVDLPDGNLFSRPPPSPDVEVVEEEVVFPGLRPLYCRCDYGNEEKMRELRDRAELVLAQAVPLVHSSLKKLEQVLVSCYPTLSSPTQREDCQSVLESLFFPALLPPLLTAYRCKHYAEEVSTARNMCRHVNATPKDLDVRRKFWLVEQSSAPYKEVVDELCRVSDLHYPSVKLTCLVSTSRLVVQCIDDYYEAQGQPKGAVDSGVGVDDILPILSYIIIRSGLPQLVSETALMEDFIQDGYVKGEEGFCLTSFMTALKFVSHMSS